MYVNIVIKMKTSRFFTNNYIYISSHKKFLKEEKIDLKEEKIDLKEYKWKK